MTILRATTLGISPQQLSSARMIRKISLFLRMSQISALIPSNNYVTNNHNRKLRINKFSFHAVHDSTSIGAVPAKDLNVHTTPVSSSSSSSSLSTILRKLKNHFLLSPHTIHLSSYISDEVLNSIRQLPEIQFSLNLFNQMQMLPYPQPHENINLIRNHLQRAQEIFQTFLPNGGQNEYVAILLLQIDFLQNHGFFQEAQDKLQLLKNQTNKNLSDTTYKHDVNRWIDQMDPFHILLVQIKLAWMMGSFETSTQLAKEACDRAVVGFSSSSSSFQSHEDGGGLFHKKRTDLVLRQGMALNLLALSKLAHLDYNDGKNILDSHHPADGQKYALSLQSQVREAEEIQGILKMASTMLRNEYQHVQESYHHISSSTSSQYLPNNLVMASAISYCNQGIAELFFVSIKKSMSFEDDKIPTDPAMMAWRHALSFIEDWEDSNANIPTEKDKKQMNFHDFYDWMLMDLLRAKVLCNMAHALLFFSYKNLNSTLTEHDLKTASDFAGNALKIYNKYVTSDYAVVEEKEGEDVAQLKEDIQTLVRPSLARALTLVASCYSRAGAAVTAQGLFQSAIDILDTPTKNYLWPVTGIDARSALLNYAFLCQNWEKRDTDFRFYSEKAKMVDDTLVHDWRRKSSILSGICFPVL